MAIQVDYPGVYIDEFAPSAPIQGVGTSTAAFLGVCKYGPPNEPTMITSWDAFLKTFTSGKPVNQDPPDDDNYLWYAVQGFFANGGRVCYVTAISNASPDHADLNDAASAATITVSARQSGISNPTISVSAGAAHSVKPYDATNNPTGARLFQPTATVNVIAASPGKVTFGSEGDAAKFVAGDRLKIDGGGHTEFPTVMYRSGRDVFLTADLTSTYVGATVTLAPTDPTSFRVSGDAAALVVGSIVTLTQTANTASPKTTVVTSVTRQRLTTSITTYGVSVRDDVSGFDPYGTNPVTLQSEEFSLTVSGHPLPYDGLSMNSGHPRYYETVVNGDPARTITVAPYRNPSTGAPNVTALPGNRPTTTTSVNLGGGSNFNSIQVTANDYGDALNKLKAVKDVNIVVVADRMGQDVQSLVLAHCEKMKDRFAIFSAQKAIAVQDLVSTQLGWLLSDKGFGALYYPWISVTSAKSSLPILVPPSGHVAGIYARTDASRGVFKAPAGNEASVATALGVERMLNDTDHGVLNLKGVNVIRVFQQGGRPIVWGARTTATTVDTNWQYVNIRRLFIYLEQSIQRGIRGAVFEPNNIALWEKLKRTIRAFLMTQWRDGALFGKTAEEAFYIRIDDVLNPFSEQALGRLNIEIGVRPSYPAEFIVVRIGIWQGGSDVSES